MDITKEEVHRQELRNILFSLSKLQNALKKKDDRTKVLPRA